MSLLPWREIFPSLFICLFILRLRGSYLTIFEQGYISTLVLITCCTVDKEKTKCRNVHFLIHLIFLNSKFQRKHGNGRGSCIMPLLHAACILTFLHKMFHFVSSSVKHYIEFAGFNMHTSTPNFIHNILRRKCIFCVRLSRHAYTLTQICKTKGGIPAQI